MIPRLAFFIFGFWFGAILADLSYPTREAVAFEAKCSTDSDCMKHCPPPNDDPDCDGGGPNG